MDKQQALRYLSEVKTALETEEKIFVDLTQKEKHLSWMTSKQKRDAISPFSVGGFLFVNLIKNCLTAILPSAIISLIAQVLHSAFIYFKPGEVWPFICRSFIISLPILTIIWTWKDYKDYIKKEKSNVEFNRQQNIKKRAALKHKNQLIQEINTCRITHTNAKQHSARLLSRGIHLDRQLTSMSIDEMIGYLTSGQANTLEKAVQLYEQHWDSFELEMAENRSRAEKEKEEQFERQALRNEIAHLRRDCEDAAARADDAAFWGSVAAYETDKLYRELKK